METKNDFSLIKARSLRLVIKTVQVTAAKAQNPTSHPQVGAGFQWFRVGNISIWRSHCPGCFGRCRLPAGLLSTHGVFALTIRLPFCGLNILDSFFCDIRQLAKLACANTYTVELLMFLNNGIVIVTCFVLLISYTVLLLKLQTHSTKAKKKITSTCVSHIVVVFVTFGPAIYIYVLPFQAVPVEKVVALFHTVIFPLTNPIIYTLCNKEIKSSMWKLVCKYLQQCRLFKKYFEVNK
ncbi:hypothetical protein ASZ78_011003 [Callipepla squamata]|uniref:G-protein coupled receptors family 1 profile domain-containing protein n=1 Tax=Callipepla squamata TaxID=9009 RepID=A0A226NF69_CALSU|nr:hypothetical protein ASZ78_011003 [Callipepla squamata]